MLRPLLGLLLALLLAGCVVPVDPMRLAARGPTVGAQMTAAGHALAAGERIALVIQETQLDPQRLQRCIADGMRTRLPQPGPAVVALDEAAAARLAASLPAEQDAPLPEEVSVIGAAWAILVRDGSRRAATPESGFGGQGGGGGAMLGGYVGERVDYALSLEAVILDLQARRRLGRATAWYAAQGGGGIAAGIIGGGGIALPFVLPIIRLPGGTSALAICNAFGRSLGDALVAATTPQPPATPAAAP